MCFIQDPSKRHELDRTTVRSLVCALCDLQQPVASVCAGCGCEFGAYACLKCCFFDDDLQKQQFHCEACGICRVGGASNFFHCHTCGCCYANSLRVLLRNLEVFLPVIPCNASGAGKQALWLSRRAVCHLPLLLW